MRADLPWRIRLQYLLSSMFFLSGWTFALYMAFPIIRILTGAQPLAGTTADQFLLHFAPYFCVSLVAVAVAGAGRYTFDAFALLIANFWVHIVSTFFVLLRRKGRFVVTAKHGRDEAQPATVIPALGVLAVLAFCIVWAMARTLTAATVNNVAFAVLHLSVLLIGAWPALVGRRVAPAQVSEPVETVDAEAA